MSGHDFYTDPYSLGYYGSDPWWHDPEYEPPHGQAYRPPADEPIEDLEQPA